MCTFFLGMLLADFIVFYSTLVLFIKPLQHLAKLMKNSTVDLAYLKSLPGCVTVAHLIIACTIDCAVSDTAIQVLCLICTMGLLLIVK
jgi:hypothetical protein